MPPRPAECVSAGVSGRKNARVEDHCPQHEQQPGMRAYYNPNFMHQKVQEVAIALAPVTSYGGALG